MRGFINYHGSSSQKSNIFTSPFSFISSLCKQILVNKCTHNITNYTQIYSPEGLFKITSTAFEKIWITDAERQTDLLTEETDLIWVDSSIIISEPTAYVPASHSLCQVTVFSLRFKQKNKDINNIELVIEVHTLPNLKRPEVLSDVTIDCKYIIYFRSIHQINNPVLFKASITRLLSYLGLLK